MLTTCFAPLRDPLPQRAQRSRCNCEHCIHAWRRAWRLPEWPDENASASTARHCPLRRCAVSAAHTDAARADAPLTFGPCECVCIGFAARGLWQGSGCIAWSHRCGRVGVEAYGRVAQGGRPATRCGVPSVHSSAEMPCPHPVRPVECKHQHVLHSEASAQPAPQCDSRATRELTCARPRGWLRLPLRSAGD